MVPVDDNDQSAVAQQMLRFLEGHKAVPADARRGEHHARSAPGAPPPLASCDPHRRPAPLPPPPPPLSLPPPRGPSALARTPLSALARPSPLAPMPELDGVRAELRATRRQMQAQCAEHAEAQARAEARGAAAEAQVAALAVRVRELEAALGHNECTPRGDGGGSLGPGHTGWQMEQRHHHVGLCLKEPRRVGDEEPSPNCVLSGLEIEPRSNRDRLAAASRSNRDSLADNSTPPPPRILDSAGGSRASFRHNNACSFSRTFAAGHVAHMARASTAESVA